MAGITQTESRGRGGRRSLDATLNLVPFIDLLSCCISFLLITAVWVNLAQMDVRQKTPGHGDESAAKEVELTLYIDRDGYRFTRSTGESETIGLLDGDHDDRRLDEVLGRAKLAHATIESLVIQAADGVPYQRIIRTMDHVVRSGDRPLFPNVSLGAQAQGGAL